MTKNLFHFAYLALVLVALLLVSCSSRQNSIEEPLMNPNSDRAAYQAPQPEESIEQVDLKNAFFAYDKWELKPEAKKALRLNAEWLRKHPTAHAQIEGLCDERGTQEYNLALGDKRAEAAKRYLMKLGVAANRITTVSYGAVPGREARTMAKNRRASLVIVYAK